MGRRNLKWHNVCGGTLSPKEQKLMSLAKRTLDDLWLSQCLGTSDQDHVRLEKLPCRYKLVVTVIQEKCSCVGRGLAALLKLPAASSVPSEAAPVDGF